MENNHKSKSDNELYEDALVSLRLALYLKKQKDVEPSQVLHMMLNAHEKINGVTCKARSARLLSLLCPVLELQLNRVVRAGK